MLVVAIQKVHETLQACDDRNSKVAEGLLEFRGGHIPTRDLDEHTTTSVFAREGQDAPEQSFRDNKFQKPVMLELS